MSNVGYDLDTSGGLMPLIRALIKPPDDEANGQRGRKQPHPYYKRPGKGHNRDSCDACGEGGDLICCDRCPASFHLGCYDPPLDKNDIPAGLWLCRECRGADGDDAATSSRGSRAHSPADSRGEDKKRTLRSKKGKDDTREEVSDSESVTRDKGSKEKEKEKAGSEGSKEDEDLSPMEVLLRAARVMNPRQFELPREMRVPCPFPGTEKEDSNGAPSLVTVDAAGLVPLPAKACYACGGTCKAAPLLQCDYCPLLFHQDCLDPPLTALPQGRWMCPNHVEQYIDWQLVNSISASERVALWDRFAQPLDQHAVKIDFIRRARARHPCFRVKVPVGVRGRVVVPPAVRGLYARPPPLLPSRREHVRCRNVLKKVRAARQYDEDEDLEAPKQAVCLNAQCPQYGGQGPCPGGPQGPPQGPKGTGAKLEGATAHDTDNDLNAIGDTKPDKASDSELSDSDFEYLTAAVKRRKMSLEHPLGGSGAPKERVGLRGEAGAAALLAAVDQQLEKLDERLVKLLAWQRLQQVLVGEQCGGPWRRAPLSPWAEALVSRSVDRAQLQRHGFRHVALPSQLLTRTERERISQSVFGALEPPPPAPPGAGHVLADCALRATLSPVIRPANGGLGDGLGRPVAMRLSRLSVGTDSGCDLVLSEARCRRVSRRHAVIFADEVTRHFELINYSEWGSRVNGVLYACDLAPTPPQPPREGEGQDDRAQRVRDIVRRRMPRAITARDESAEDDLCSCIGAPLGPAWEGSALVPHGALLHFGCQMFVFSIVDAPLFPYDQKVDDPAL